MTRYALPAALLACLGLLAALWGVELRRQAVQAEVQRLGRELTTAKLAIEDQQRVAEIHRAHVDRLARQAAESAALLADLETMEGQDAPLSDLLDAAAGRLWPTK